MKVLDLPGLKRFNTKISALIDKRIEKAMISHVLDSTNTSMVLGADVGPKVTQLINNVNTRVDRVNSDLTRKYITPTFKTGYSSEGNRGYITLSGKIVTVNLGVYSDAGYGAGEVVASIPAEYAPTLAFATGCYIGSAIDKIESVGYAYINTAGEILIADSNFTKRKIARLVVTYQIA